MKGYGFAGTALIAALGIGAQFASAQLLLHYGFDEAASGSAPAADLGAAPPAPGTFEGGATRTGNTPAGFSLGAADLSAANTYVTTADPDKLDGLGTLTLTAWVNLQAAPVHGNRIMSKQVASGAFEGFSFAFNNPTGGAGALAADNFRLNLALGGQGGFGFFVSDQDLGADNTWVFVAATYDGSGAVTFYTGGEADGATVGSLGGTGAANPGTLLANDRDFRVGAQSEGTISAPVWIDDVRVYGSVLSLSELDDVRLANIPEPATLILLGLGSLFLARRRRVA